MKGRGGSAAAPEGPGALAWTLSVLLKRPENLALPYDRLDNVGVFVECSFNSQTIHTSVQRLPTQSNDAPLVWEEQLQWQFNARTLKLLKRQGASIKLNLILLEKWKGQSGDRDLKKGRRKACGFVSLHLRTAITNGKKGAPSEESHMIKRAPKVRGDRPELVVAYSIKQELSWSAKSKAPKPAVPQERKQKQKGPGSIWNADGGKAPTPEPRSRATERYEDDFEEAAESPDTPANRKSVFRRPEPDTDLDLFLGTPATSVANSPHGFPKLPQQKTPAVQDLSPLKDTSPLESSEGPPEQKSSQPKQRSMSQPAVPPLKGPMFGTRPVPSSSVGTMSSNTSASPSASPETVSDSAPPQLLPNLPEVPTAPVGSRQLPSPEDFILSLQQTRDSRDSRPPHQRLISPSVTNLFQDTRSQNAAGATLPARSPTDPAIRSLYEEAKIRQETVTPHSVMIAQNRDGRTPTATPIGGIPDDQGSSQSRQKLPTAHIDAPSPSPMAMPPQALADRLACAATNTRRSRQRAAPSTAARGEYLHRYRVSVDLHAVRDLAQTYCLQLRYVYPLLGDPKPVMTNPPTLVQNNSEVQLPNAFCAFEFEMSPTRLTEGFRDNPLLVEVIHKDQYSDDIEVGIVSISLWDLLSQPPRNGVHMLDKFHPIFDLKVSEDDGDQKDPAQVGNLRAVLSLEDFGTQEPEQEPIEAPAEAKAYNAAWELEIWKRDQKAKWKARWTALEKQKREDLETHYRRMTDENRLAHERKMAELEKQERRLRNRGYDHERTSRRLKMDVEQMQARKAEQERELKLHKQEAMHELDRAKDSHRHAIDNLKRKVSQLTKENVLLQTKFDAESARCDQMQEDFKSHKRRVEKSTMGQLKLELESRDRAIEERERKIEEGNDTERRLRAQLMRSLQEIARLREVIREKDEKSLAEERERLRKVKLSLMTKDSQKMLRNDRSELESIRRSLNQLMQPGHSGQPQTLHTPSGMYGVAGVPPHASPPFGAAPSEARSTVPPWMVQDAGKVPERPNTAPAAPRPLQVHSPQVMPIPTPTDPAPTPAHPSVRSQDDEVARLRRERGELLEQGYTPGASIIGRIDRRIQKLLCV